MPLNGALRSRAGDDRDRGHWYPKGGMFLLWTVTDLIVTRLLGGRDNINPIVSFISKVGLTKYVELMIFILFWLGAIEELCPSFF